MPEKELKGADKASKKRPLKVTFRCQYCKRLRPLEEMRSVTRFLPVLIMCRDCEKKIR